MITLNLTAKGMEEESLKQYLEENASESLADKINNGVTIEKDGKKLLNKKTLASFMQYACEEAKKQAEKGAIGACVHSDTVFSWAIHYFEEESIIGTLYNEDGTEYKAAPKKVNKKTTATPAIPATPKKPASAQCSLFDIEEEEPKKEEPIQEVEEEADDELDNITDEEVGNPEELEDVEEPEEEKTSVSPIYTRYLKYVTEYPNAIVAMRVGDFYEILGKNSRLISQKLDLTLTSRDLGVGSKIPMVGFPYHRKDVYVQKIAAFSEVVVVESDDSVDFYTMAKKTEPVYQVNAKTGEAKSITPDENNLIALAEKLIGEDLEVEI